MTCNLPKLFLSKNLPNRSICRRQFANSRFAKNNNVFWPIFNFLCSKKMLNHNFLTYDLLKCHFNNTNVFFMTWCNDQQYLNKRTSKGLQAKRAPSDSPAVRMASFRVSKSWLFLLNCQIVRFWQIVNWQIVVQLHVSWLRPMSHKRIPVRLLQRSWHSTSSWTTSEPISAIRFSLVTTHLILNN